MELITLEEAIKKPMECEEFQLKNWLNMLSEYIKRDTPMKIEKGVLSGKMVCPNCQKLMALRAENYCDKCGQKLTK